MAEISFKDPAVECYIHGNNALNFFRINEANYHDKLNNYYNFFSCLIGSQSYHRDRTCLLWGKAEGIGIVQPEEEMAAFQYLMGAYKRAGEDL